MGVAYLPLLAIPLGMLWLFISLRQIAPTDTFNRRNEIQFALARHSDAATGNVVYTPKSSPRGSDIWDVEFVPIGNTKAVVYSLTEANANMDALMREVGFGKPHEKEVKLVYSPEDTSKYWVADYLPLDTPPWRPSWIGAFFASVWFGLIAPTMLIYPSLKVWQLYLGMTNERLEAFFVSGRSDESS